ncbi:hypothetical protein [Peribacillus sp. ACCC06369]|uniref:hypothetical protein n=1 Tax=Peribacillus sp. ACCC06369 TaxID=3055860 RepID=UPI0025A07A31|nr:hypothetical protein [Peribacillus sp. ACCC06369]MDM5358569.1 hypothetical protein [Peribacillus sp. ACCC06369]
MNSAALLASFAGLLVNLAVLLASFAGLLVNLAVLLGILMPIRIPLILRVV